MKTKSFLLLTPILLSCFALLPIAQAAPSPSNVIVVNTPASPVPVRDVDNPARQPFQATAGGSFVDGSCDTGSITITTVPAGKRLVIEHVECKGTFLHELGHNLTFCHVDTTVGTTTVRYDFSHVTTGLDECLGEDISVSVADPRWYADSGTAVYGGATRNSTSGNDDTVAFAISGYLVDCPTCAQ